MKKSILATTIMFLSASITINATAANYAVGTRAASYAKYTKHTHKIKQTKITKIIPMRRGQKTQICGKAGETITAALANINGDLAKPQVQSHTVKNLTVNRPFVAASAPIVHTEKRKRSAKVYVACVKIKKA